jgi:hypothetical protein
MPEPREKKKARAAAMVTLPNGDPPSSMLWGEDA